MRELSCAECVDLCAEVALGIADAEDRAEVLVHVEHCRTCRAELRSLGEVADTLVELVPPAAPSPDFASRTAQVVAGAARVRAAEEERRWWSVERLRRVAVAAAVVVAAAVGAGGWLLGQTTSKPTSRVTSAALVSDRTAVGELMIVTSGEHPWISMGVHLKIGSTVVRCEVRGAHGAALTVGTFKIVDGYGYWASPLPSRFPVRAAELVTPAGRVLASAAIRPT